MKKTEEIILLIKSLSWTPEQFCEYLFGEFGTNNVCELSGEEKALLKEKLVLIRRKAVRGVFR